MGAGTPQIIAWRSSAAEVCLRLGRLEQARSLAAEEVALARAIGAPRAIGVALRATALAESGARRIELLREALASLAASQGALELARARVDLGAALVRAGQRDEARGVLRAGQEGAVAAGRDAAGRARAPRAAGHRRRPRRTAAAGRDGLTPSELRVTEMAAARADQPRDRPGAVRDREDGRDAPRAGVHEARRALAQAARPGARPRAGRGGLTPARVTLATVAEALGVSTMTVSNAYNRPEKLSPELRERILAKADELGYAGPNALARSLRRGRTGVLGVVLGEALTYAFEDPATVEFFRGLASAGIALQLVPATGGEDDAALVLDAAVDAFVLYALPDGHPLVEAVLRRRLPVVVQSGPQLEGHPFVAIDERAAAAAAADAPARARPHAAGGALAAVLADATAPTARCGPSAPAHRVTARAAEGYGVAVGREVQLNDRAHGERPRRRAARRPRPADGAAVHERRAGDRRAAGRAARGLVVPRELSVVGWDDTPEARAPIRR